MKYTNRKSGLNVVTGKVKDINDNNFVMTVDSFDSDKKPVTEDITINGKLPEGVKAGFTVTAVGYQAGPHRYTAEQVMNGNTSFERDGLAVVSGFVRSARLNEEKDENGVPKKNQKGEDKKPHFDLTITTKDDDKYVNHRIKIYNSEKNPDAIEKAQKQYGKVGEERTDKDSDTKYINSIRGTFITGEGRSYEMESNGYTNYYCDHLGLTKADYDYVRTEPREQSQAKDNEQAPAEMEQGGDGFMSIPDGIDEELPFN